MSRIDELRPIFVDSIPESKEFEEGILYISEKYGCAQHLCPCGCGDRVVISLQPFWEDGWELIKLDSGKVTIKPSILNPGCVNRSHYFITESKIDWK